MSDSFTTPTSRHPIHRTTSLMSLSKDDILHLIKSISFESIHIPRNYATDSTDDTATFVDCVCSELAKCLAANSPGKSPQKLLESRKMADNNSNEEELMNTPIESTFSSFDSFTTGHCLSGITESPSLEISKQSVAIETPGKTEKEQEDPRRKLIEQLDLHLNPFHSHRSMNANTIHPSCLLRVPIFDESVDMDEFASTEEHKRILKTRSSFLLDQLDIDPFVSI